MTARKKLFLSATIFGLICGAGIYFFSIAPRQGGFEGVATASRQIRRDEYLRIDMIKVVSMDPKKTPDDAIRESDILQYGGYISKRDIGSAEILRTIDFKR